MGRQIKKKALFISGFLMAFCLILLLASFPKKEVYSLQSAYYVSVSENKRLQGDTVGLKSEEENASHVETSTIVYSSLPWTDGNSDVRSWILLVLFVFVNLTLLYRDDKRQRILEKKEKAAEQYIRVDR